MEVKSKSPIIRHHGFTGGIFTEMEQAFDAGVDVQKIIAKVPMFAFDGNGAEGVPTSVAMHGIYAEIDGVARAVVRDPWDDGYSPNIELDPTLLEEKVEFQGKADMSNINRHRYDREQKEVAQKQRMAEHAQKMQILQTERNEIFPDKVALLAEKVNKVNASYDKLSAMINLPDFKLPLDNNELPNYQAHTGDVSFEIIHKLDSSINRLSRVIESADRINAIVEKQIKADPVSKKILESRLDKFKGFDFVGQSSKTLMRNLKQNGTLLDKGLLLSVNATDSDITFRVHNKQGDAVIEIGFDATEDYAKGCAKVEDRHGNEADALDVIAKYVYADENADVYVKVADKLTDWVDLPDGIKAIAESLSVRDNVVYVFDYEYDEHFEDATDSYADEAIELAFDELKETSGYSLIIDETESREPCADLTIAIEKEFTEEFELLSKYAKASKHFNPSHEKSYDANDDLAP